MDTEALKERLEGGMSEIKLGRIGHYNSGSGCQTAIVADWLAQGTVVNLLVIQHDAETMPRRGVPVGPPSGEGSFHLNRDCPFSR